jgi:predicted PurR-regulated permease PerM
VNSRHEHSFENKVSRWFFAVCIIFVLWLAYRLAEPFLVPIFLSLVMVEVAGPLYDRLLAALGGRKVLASALVCLLLFFLIALPLFAIVGVIAFQAQDLYSTISGLLKDDTLEKTFREMIGVLPPHLVHLHDSLGIDQRDVLQHVGELVRSVSNTLYANFIGIIKGFTSLLIGFAEVFFVSFYLLMDGSTIADRAFALSPLPAAMNERIRSDILVSLRSTLKGTVVLAVIQGLAGGIVFWIFGVPNAPFWGTVMVFASVVPLVGTALVWAPAGFYLLVISHPGQALAVSIWCLAAGVICDNFLRPKLLGGQCQLHPLLTFFSVLGGLSLFGVLGLILGPLVLAVLLSLLEVYERYFLNGEEPAVDQATLSQAPDPSR